VNGIETGWIKYLQTFDCFDNEKWDLNLRLLPFQFNNCIHQTYHSPFSHSGTMIESTQRLKTPVTSEQQQDYETTATTTTTTTWSSFRNNRRKISPLTQLHEKDEDSWYLL